MVGLMNICSTWGSGKTTLATCHAELCAKIGIPVYSDYDMDIKDCSVIEPHELFSLGEDYNIDTGKKCTVIIDEAYSWLESRNYGSDLNKYLSYILMQSRKRGMEFITTEQLNSTIDIRFQQLAEIVVASIMLKDRFRYIYIYDGLKIAKREIMFKSLTKIVDMRLLKDKSLWLCSKEGESKDLFHCFRTEQIIKPVKFNELQSKVENIDLSKLNDKITFLAKVFHTERGTFTYQITQAVVDDFLLKHSSGKCSETCTNTINCTSDLSYPLYGRLKSEYVAPEKKSSLIKIERGN
jgi:hypothetical protein